jgi:hypothetical protein
MLLDAIFGSEWLVLVCGVMSCAEAGHANDSRTKRKEMTSYAIPKLSIDFIRMSSWVPGRSGASDPREMFIMSQLVIIKKVSVQVTREDLVQRTDHAIRNSKPENGHDGSQSDA